MPSQKQVKSFELVPGRDDDIIEYLERPEISASAAARTGLRLLIAQEAGERDIMARLEKIIAMLSDGVTVTGAAGQEKFNDPFLDQSL